MVVTMSVCVCVCVCVCVRARAPTQGAGKCKAPEQMQESQRWWLEGLVKLFFFFLISLVI